jgi:hypothetical protein
LNRKGHKSRWRGCAKKKCAHRAPNCFVSHWRDCVLCGSDNRFLISYLAVAAVIWSSFVMDGTFKAGSNHLLEFMANYSHERLDVDGAVMTSPSYAWVKDHYTQTLGYPAAGHNYS